ncbi:E3 ubiquitin-protein ligase MARCHF5-like [Pholidichthys leucotaenia]
MALAEPEKVCWVCFSTELNEPGEEWVSPCRCSGSTKWVHQSCVQLFVDSRLKVNRKEPVKCQLCGTTYHLFFPKMGSLFNFLKIVDEHLTRCSRVGMLFLFSGTVYWSAVTSGCLTVMQVMGQMKGLHVMQKAKPLVLLIGLPIIPVVLVIGKVIRWDVYIMKLWHNYCYKRTSRLHPSIPCNKPIVPTSNYSMSRTLCGALMFPSIASLMGHLLFRRVSSNLHRTMLGGVTYLLIKGMLKIYYKQQLCISQANRQICNYPEINQDDGDEQL